MTNLLYIIKEGNPIALLAIGCALLPVGSAMAGRNAGTQKAAKVAAAAAFLLYLLHGGIDEWDWFQTVLRALLTGFLALSVSLIAFAVLRFVFAGPIPRAKPRRHEAYRSIPPKMAPSPSPSPPLSREETERLQREQNAKIDDARAEVIRFYDEHEPLIRESLPPALFRTQLQNQFPDGKLPEQAWKAAQEMIAAMLPLIAQGREKQRAEEDERNKQELEKSLERKPATIELLTKWHENRKEEIERSVPPGPDRDVLLGKLYDRFDKLLKDLLEELKP